jgi:hypothetical protein
VWRPGWILTACCLIVTTALWAAARFPGPVPANFWPWQALSQITVLWSVTLMAIAMLAVVRANALEPVFGGLDRAVRFHKIVGPAATPAGSRSSPMLRTTSLENYDAWTKGELPFSSPEVTNAAEVMSEIWLNEDYVYGGTAAIVSTAFGDAPTPMFDDPPKCWLHRQGNFVTSFFPAGTEAGVDFDFFYLPSDGEEYGKPFLIAGDIFAMFNDRPEVRALIEYFTTYESVAPWIKIGGGAISPHKNAVLADYVRALGADELDYTAGSFEILAKAAADEMLSKLQGLIDSSSRRVGTLTNLSGALDHAGELLKVAPFATTRQVVNVIGNGEDNVGEDPQRARADLKAAGVRINGVVVGGDPAVLAYYRANVVGGLMGFVLPVARAEDLVDVFARKFVTEISAR